MDSKRDLLVTDQLMPGMSGAELAPTLRSSHSATKVLLVSGFANTEGVAPDLPYVEWVCREILTGERGVVLALEAGHKGAQVGPPYMRHARSTAYAAA